MKYPFQIKTSPASHPGSFCDCENCQNPAAFKAPRSRASTQYYWFCLEHVRLYNAAWDYFDGFSSQQIEAQIKHDFVWERASWPFGQGKDDPVPTPPAAQEPPIPPKYKRALSVLGLAPPLTADDVKQRYRSLVKRYHPDTNNGSRDNEERLKDIVEAYETLDEWLERAA